MRLRLLSGTLVIVLATFAFEQVAADEAVIEGDVDAIQRAVDGRFTRSDSEDVPDHLDDLSLDQSAMILYDLFYEPNHLSEIEDRRLAHQIMDMLVVHGPREVLAMLDGAIADLKPSQPALARVLSMVADQGSTGTLGPSTQTDNPLRQWVDARMITRLNLITRHGLGRELRNALVDARLRYLQATGASDTKPGWTKRAMMFRE